MRIKDRCESILGNTFASIHRKILTKPIIAANSRFRLRHILFIFNSAIIAHALLGQHLSVSFICFLFLALLLILLLSFFIGEILRPLFVYGCVFMLGFLLANIEVGQQIQSQLPAKLEKKDINVIAKIVSLPKEKAHAVEFDIELKNVHYANVKYTQIKLARIRDYNKRHEYQYGQYWQFTLRLKKPRGYVNPGSRFDFEKYLFYQRVDAVGYVKSAQFIRPADDNWINTIMLMRNKWQNFVKNSDPKNALYTQERALLNALLVGLRDEISNKQWQVLQKTGTAHLFAISGLHIGFVAFIITLTFSYLLKYSKRYGATRPVQDYALIIALLFSVFYAALAGFSIPTKRALIALVIYALFYFSRTRTSVIDVVLATIAVLLLIDPLSPLSASFWLSCGAVIVLIFVAQILLKPQHKRDWKAKVVYWLKLQFALCFFMQILTYVFFAKFVLFSPIANMIAIPVIALLVIPVGLTAVMLFLLANWVNAVWLLSISSILVDFVLNVLAVIWFLLAKLSELPYASMNLPHWPISTLFVGIVILCLCLLPFLRFKILALIILSLLFIWRPERLPQDAYEVLMFDVGQGLAIAVKTRNHLMLFDTGAAYTSGFNMGQAVIAPYLHSLSVKQITMVLISHRHNDHAGGWSFIKENFLVKQKLTGAKKYFPEFRRCVAGQTWQVDGVNFQVLWPSVNYARNYSKAGNNSSCVVKVYSQYGSFLFTADIEKKVEQVLLDSMPDKLKSDVLQVAHQGSKTSSKLAFIKAVNPKFALVSSGYLNRFSHPHKEVLQRFADEKVTVLNTAYSGAIHARFSMEGIQLTKMRDQSQFYWRQ